MKFLRLSSGSVLEGVGLTPDELQTITNKTIDSMTNTIGADHIHYKVKNMTGNTLANGTLVKVAGYEAGDETFRVTPTTNTNDVAIGIVKGTILQGEVGLVVNTGVVTGINTTGYPTGSILYQNGAGGLTHTKPTTGAYQAVAIPLNAKVDGALLVEFTEPNPVDWDSRYYTETEVNNLLSGKQNTITGAASSVVTNKLNANVVVTTDASGNLTHATDISTTELSYLNGVTSAIQTQLNDKAATTHTHAISDVTGLQTALDGKAESIHTHTVSQITDFDSAVNSKIQAVVGAAPEALDTLAEIAAQLGDDQDTVAVLAATVAGKADAVHTHANATTSTAGFMSSADKTKLDGVATSANNYAHPTGDGNLHVPATGTTNSGKVLTAGSTAGSLSWTDLPAVPVTSVARLTTPQVSNNTTEQILDGFTFTIPPGKTATINCIMIFSSAGTLAGAFLGVRVSNAAGSNGNIIGSWQAYVNITSAPANSGLADGDVLIVTPGTTSSTGSGVTGTASTAGNNSSSLLLLLSNTSTNANSQASIVFRSETTTAVTAQVGTIATCILS